MDVTERFLKYVAYDTQSKEEEKQVPSTQKQLVLARELEQELITMGAEHVRVSSHGYVFADIPATDKGGCPALGFIAHMDTSPACSGKHVTPQIIKNYDGKKIKLSGREGVSLTPEAFPELINYKGQDLITTDGTTLLGADDKAGIAEIMTMTEHLLRHPEISHGKICIGFTPDEEVGKGTAFFDVADFGADAAYTVDGGALGELEYENFNAATAKIQIYGVSIHTGSAKGQMKNALLIGMELQSMLPVFENPAATEGYEGFYHLDRMSGTVEQTDMVYLIRDHDMEKFEDKKRLLEQAAFYLNGKYGTGTILISIQDTYYNMLEKIKPHRYLIDLAKESMEELGITPKISPIRGGTDGARLSYMGLPCPNLGTGGHNFHGRYEFIPIRSMEKTVELLVKLAERFAARR